MGSHAPYADPGVPDIRGPVRYLGWLVGRQGGRMALAALWSTLWMVTLTLQPYLVARAIDDGLRPGDPAVVAWWAAAVLGAGGLNAGIGLLRHRTMTFVRTDAMLRTVQVVVRHVTRLGATLPRKVSTGEVVNIGTTDITAVGRTLIVAGPCVGAVLACATVAVLLFTVSPVLAVVVLVGMPLLVVALGPLLGRLQRAETRYREQQGALTARAGDIVAGLRVLCGLGGKDMFAARYHERSRALRAEGYRVGATTSWLEALSIGLPALFLAVVTWLAARMTATGQISVGELVAVHGYVAALLIPVFFFVEGAAELGRGLVAARRVIRLLALRPQRDPDPVPGPAAPADLHDPASGLTVPAGGLLAVAAERPADAVTVLDRLGRYTDSAATFGGVPLTAMALPEVRRRILVADNDAHLFGGLLRQTVATRRDHDDEAVAAALHAAAAEDVAAGLAGGLDGRVEAQARNLSGGQRQRLRLARALLADTEVLLLVEPTSAVDTHTEALVAQRLRAARPGRTTVLTTTSPLLLDRADLVAYLVSGMVTATGTHAELLAAEPGYRALVFRGAEDEEPAGAAR